MPEITSDDVHQELMKFGVPPDEIFRAVGSLLKIAQKRNWIQKSGRCATSQSGRGGTIHVWKSCVWKGGKIMNEYLEKVSKLEKCRSVSKTLQFIKEVENSKNLNFDEKKRLFGKANELLETFDEKSF